MKKLFIALVIIFTHSLIDGMQMPTGTSNIRVQLMNAITESITGKPLQYPINKSDDQITDVRLRSCSPEDFCGILQTKNYRNLQIVFFQQKGITPDYINYLIQSILVNRANNNLSHLPPASSPIKKIALQATQHMNGAQMRVVCDNSSEHIACITQNTMIVNEEKLQQTNLATPKKLSAISRHEKAHEESQDQVIREAYVQALITKEGNEKLSSHGENLRLMLFRFGEIFADLRSAGKDLAAAQETLRVTQHFLQLFGEGTPSTHPSYRDRVRLAELMVAFHKEYNEQQQSNKENTKKCTKRILYAEFNKVAKDNQSLADDAYETEKLSPIKVRIKRLRMDKASEMVSSG